MKYFFLVYFLGTITLAQGKSSPTIPSYVPEDKTPSSLQRILKSKKLRVLTSRNSFDYFIHNGDEKGYEFEMIKGLLKYLNKKYNPKKTDLKIHAEMIPVQRDLLIPLLKSGRGDIISAGMTITPLRQKEIQFSAPYNILKEVVVTHHKNHHIKTIKDLSGKRFYVKKSSSFYETLLNINKQLKNNPIKIILVKEELETEDILELVSLKRYGFTVADSHMAFLAKKVFSHLHIVSHIPLRKSAQIAWGIHKNNKKLLKEVNRFVPTFKKGSFLGNYNLKKYYKNMKRIGGYNKNRQKASTISLSPYDSTFKKYAQKYDLDWKLVASLAYQESRFNPLLNNPSGALGLMQVKASTAKDKYINIFPIEGKKHVKNNIHAGVKYLAWLRDTFFEKFYKINEQEKTKFVLAAYNAGPGKILKAIKATKKTKRNPHVWHKNVEMTVLGRKNYETVNYVYEILRRQTAYHILLGKNKK